MAVFKVQAPDGTVIKVEAADQATAIRGAQEHYASRSSSRAKDVAASSVSGLTRGVAGIADAVARVTPVGMVNQAINVGNVFADVASKVTGQKPPPKMRTFSAADAVNPFRHKPQTTAGEVAETVGENVPNALMPASIPARLANVFLPAAGSEIGKRVAKAAGADERGQAIGGAIGAVGGAAASSVRAGNPFAVRTAEERAAEIVANRARPDPSAMRRKAGEIRAAGVEPTLVDVAGDRGRRLVRAVGVKSEQAGETLADNARTVSSSAKPAIMARTQGIGPNRGKTADQLLDDLVTARDDAATTNYAEPYAQKINITPETVSALRGPEGEAAIRRAMRAASARRDANLVGELQRLLQATRAKVLPGSQSQTGYNTRSAAQPPIEPVSGAALDRVQIAFRKTAEGLEKNDASDIAGGLRGRQGSINNELDAFDGLKPARADYRAKSQAIDVLGKGRKDVFSTDPADYGHWLESLSPEARSANQVAIRQEILDTLGGQRSATFGTVDELATSQYAQANLRQALGADAEPYLANLRARLEQVRNARMVDPNGGSRTAPLQNDLEGVMSTAKNVVTQNWWGVAGDFLRRRGISDRDAQALAEAAVDPQRLSAVMAALEQRVGRQEAQRFIALRNASIAAATSGAIAAPAASQAQP